MALKIIPFHPMSMDFQTKKLKNFIFSTIQNQNVTV